MTYYMYVTHDKIECCPYVGTRDWDYRVHKRIIDFDNFIGSYSDSIFESEYDINKVYSKLSLYHFVFKVFVL